MSKNWIWYVGFFVLLIGGYLLYISKTIGFSNSQLPIINERIMPFAFTNQDGKKVTEHDVDGKVYVAEFFFTTCKGICPKMNANMRRVFDIYKNEKDFMIMSHTCMPETDSVPLLKQYQLKMINGKLDSTKYGNYFISFDSSDLLKPVNNSNWNFVTGDKRDLYNMARHSYLIDNNKSDTTAKIADQFIHTQLFALVDKQTNLRGIYDGLKEDEVKKLIHDIGELIVEKRQTRSLKGF